MAKVPSTLTLASTVVHPKEKKLFCPACQSSFLRVSAIIKHLEDDQCRGVHGIRFALWMRRVDLLNALVAGAEHAQDTLRNGYKEFSADCLKKFNGGGLMDPVTKVDMSDAKEWPSLPTHKKESNPAPTGNKDLDSPATGKLQLHKTPKPPEPKKPPAPKQVGRIRVDFDPYNWPPAEDELMGELTKGFPPDTYLIKNLLPSHREADPERFYNKLLNRYYCDRCDWYAHTAVKLEAHRLFQHATEKIECPRCHKEFKTYYSLMTHVESENTRCSLAATCRLGQAAQIAAELELRTGKAQIETGRFNWKAYLKYME
ncbi:hypothetical protein EJ06DRAFT_558685 [Trichodelitschia bisporula]|uniref:C2H2-type domain-containing protein n=1 Tax=Trichodelitschia bisporula TaxID=703511 RepID=A0A6G1HPK6_9PEZI|nr:hypothetical protein EJ06DRAFT_558685 [Trichodelitschia bisporula]